MRQVPVDGELVPYWQAGPAYAPCAGGFFGGGLLPGLFLGSMLGGAFDGLGVPVHAHAESDFGDFGGATSEAAETSSRTGARRRLHPVSTTRPPGDAAQKRGF